MTHYGPISDGPDVAAVSRLIMHAFAGAPEDCAQWIRKSAGLEQVRVLRPAHDAAPAACLVRIPMGQYFGGRAVPMLGIAGVATAPETRGRGHARAMMRESVREARRDGFPLGGLFASTQALYRQVGYEQAGHRFQTSIPVTGLALGGAAQGDGDLRPLADTDADAVRACYAAFASRFAGMLDRGEYCWARVREFRGNTYHGFGVWGAGGALEGYLYLTQQRKPEAGRHDISLADIVWRTPAAARRLIGFLADFASMADKLTFFGAPLHPLVSFLPQQWFEVTKRDYWMTRVIDVKAAIESRGYLPAVRAAVELDITDELIPENAGRWTLRVENGRGTLDRASATGHGTGAVACDIRGLAPLYAGLSTATQASILGWVHGRDEDLRALDGVFGGFGTPWMTDTF